MSQKVWRSLARGRKSGLVKLSLTVSSDAGGRLTRDGVRVGLMR